MATVNVHGADTLTSVQWKARLPEIEELAKHAFKTSARHVVHCTPSTNRHDMSGHLDGCAVSVGEDEPVLPLIQGCLEDIGECTTVFTLAITDAESLKKVILKGNVVDDKATTFRYGDAVRLLANTAPSVDQSAALQRTFQTATSERFAVSLASLYNSEQARTDYFLVMRGASVVGASMLHDALVRNPDLPMRTAHTIIADALMVTRIAQAALCATLLGAAKHARDAFPPMQNYTMPALTERFLGSAVTRSLPAYIVSTPSLFTERHSSKAIRRSTFPGVYYTLYRYCTTSSACFGGVVHWTPGQPVSVVMHARAAGQGTAKLGEGAPTHVDVGKHIVLPVEAPKQRIFKEYRGLWRAMENDSGSAIKNAYTVALIKDRASVRRVSYLGAPAATPTFDTKMLLSAAFDQADFHAVERVTLTTIATLGGARFPYAETPFPVFLDIARLAKTNDTMPALATAMSTERFLAVENHMDAISVGWQKGVTTISDKTTARPSISDMDTFISAHRVIPSGYFVAAPVTPTLERAMANAAYGVTPPLPDMKNSGDLFEVTIADGTVILPWPTLLYADRDELQRYWDKASRKGDSVEAAHRFIAGEGPVPARFLLDFFASADVVVHN